MNSVITKNRNISQMWMSEKTKNKVDMVFMIISTIGLFAFLFLFVFPCFELLILSCLLFVGDIYWIAEIICKNVAQKRQ